MQRTKRTILGQVCLAVVCLSASIYCSVLAFATGHQENPPVSAFHFDVDPQIVDFGACRQNEKLRHRFALRNLSTSTVTIQEIGKSCGCTAAAPSARQILPGTEAFLDVEWNTRSLRGRNNEVIGIVLSSDFNPETSVITLTLTADIQPSVKSTVDRLEFNRTEPATKSISFHRADGNPFMITSCGASQAGMRVSHDGTEVRVTFDPNAFRSESGALVVSVWTDCPDEPYIQIPVVLRDWKTE